MQLSFVLANILATVDMKIIKMDRNWNSCFNHKKSQIYIDKSYKQNSIRISYFMSENNRGAEKQTDFWNMLNLRNEHIILTILKQNFFLYMNRWGLSDLKNLLRGCLRFLRLLYQCYTRPLICAICHWTDSRHPFSVCSWKGYTHTYISIPWPHMAMVTAWLMVSTLLLCIAHTVMISTLHVSYSYGFYSVLLTQLWFLLYVAHIVMVSTMHGSQSYGFYSAWLIQLWFLLCIAHIVMVSTLLGSHSYGFYSALLIQLWFLLCMAHPVMISTLYYSLSYVFYSALLA